MDETEAPSLDTAEQEQSLSDTISAAIDAAGAEPQEGAETPSEPQEAPQEAEPQGEAEAPSEPVSRPLDDALLASLPDEVRASVATLKQEYDTIRTQHEQALNILRDYAPIEQVLNSNRGQYQGKATDAQAVDFLFRVNDYATKDPLSYIVWFAQERGIDLLQAAERQEMPVDPQTQQLNQVNQRLSQFEQQQQRFFQEQQAERATQEVYSYYSAKNADGSPKFPHVEVIMDDLARHISLLRASDPRASTQQILQQAYEIAVWANPTTREAQIAAIRAEQVKQGAENMLRNKAKAQPKPQTPARVNVPNNTAHNSDNLEDIIRAAIDQHS